MKASGIKAEKVYELRGQVHWYRGIMPPVDEKEHVSAFLVFENEKDNQLGVPLPSGVMRIYQEDSEGMRQFAGEDRIKHTPKDETVRLRMGSAFDITAERRQTDFEIVNNHTNEAAFEIKIRNHKETDIMVDVVEPVASDWRVLERSHDFVKKDAHTIAFNVPVKRDGETVVTYRVRTRH